MKRIDCLKGVATVASALAVPKMAVAAAPDVRLLTLPTQSASTAFYADEHGFFKDAHVNVEVTSMTNGAAIVAGVLSEAAEIGASNPVSIAVAYQRGLPLTCIAPAVYYSNKAPTSALIVAPASPIKTARDLSGKTIALNGLMGIAQFAAMAWMDDNGADPKSVRFLEMSYLDMSLSLKSGRIDAAVFLEPALSQAARDHRVLAHVFDAIGSRFYLGLYFTTTTYAKTHPQIVAHVAAALRSASVWANGHPKESNAILSRVSKVDLAIVESMTRSVYAETLEPRYMQPVLDVALKYGALTSTVSAPDLIWSGA